MQSVGGMGWKAEESFRRRIVKAEGDSGPYRVTTI